MIRHSSLAIELTIIESISEIAANKINSLANDSASNCILTWGKICETEKYANVLKHRCLAHWVNLIIRKIAEPDGIKDLMTEAM